MKIEKIDNNRIRCYLDSNDLSARQIEIKELAYGTEKAKKLFSEMLEEASAEFGLEFEGAPVMIEAIPLTDSIILNISKVDDPDELDTRFSRFTPCLEDSDSCDEISSLIPQLLDGYEEQFTEFSQEHETDSEHTAASEAEKDFTRIFKFKTLDTISDAAKVLPSSQELQSTVYYSSYDNSYYLVTAIGETTKDNYLKACNTLSEFGRRIPGDSATAAYYEEHLECLIKDNAIYICKKL